MIYRKLSTFSLLFILLCHILRKLICVSVNHTQSHENLHLHRNRRSLNGTNSAIDKSYFHPGNSKLFPNKVIYGAIILSDQAPQSVIESPADYNATLQKISARIQNFNRLRSELPFELTSWSPVFTGPCPHFPNGHKTERGLIWAHYRIWREFQFFDSILDYRFNHLPEKYALTSEDGIYHIDINGTKYKNGIRIYDEDIIIIFEDDAISAIDDLNNTIIEELHDMKNIDILYLGWCEGRTARPVPLCMHAYAITRNAARKLVKYLEPCGRAIDEQLVILVKNNWISYRRAHPYSYKKMRSDYNPYGDKTNGIFRQCKNQCGSINHHRFLRVFHESDDDIS
jgi:hypothetical protein